jgi:hypothetical protein
MTVSNLPSKPTLLTLYVTGRRLLCIPVLTHMFLLLIQLASPVSVTGRAVSGCRVDNDAISDFNGITDDLEPIINLQLQFQPSHSLTHSREVCFQSTDMYLHTSYTRHVLGVPVNCPVLISCI